ncbi:hypothetical protein P4H71_28395 [Paenibacillus kribbensis]|uniref:hypothetical protein n=1 Tax=Paenibacillus kribbensis TaxID=172713 RepID=UPI002DBCDF6B|nr:hypothetical protein [Paenibacillus kribbensis]MEC0238239.1 hypothetical protein [Paenibacillus kribbensis]
MSLGQQPEAPQGPIYPLISPAVLQQQIFANRIGHYFKSNIPGFGLVTWQLISFVPPAPGADIGSGTVSMNLINPDGTITFTQVSNQDLIGLQYIGPQLPPQPQPQPQPQPLPYPPRPGMAWCSSFPSHPSCNRIEGPYRYYKDYETYWIPVHIPR